MSSAIAFAVQTALNTFAPFAPLAPLENKIVELHLQELALKLAFSAVGEKWQVTESVSPPDASISGPILTLINALNSGSIIGLYIRGDAALIQAFQNALMGVDLTQLLRELPHQIPQQFALKTDEIRRWIAETGLNLQATASEYLQHEQFLLPSRQQFNDFADQVSQLNAKLDALDYRMSQLRSLQT